MNKTIHTEIEINTPGKVVWEILTDLEKYKDWNPFISESEGTVKLGSTIINKMQNGDSVMTFKPVITRYKEGEYFEWLGSLFFKGLFDGRHSFEIQEISPNKVKLIHREEFSGLLSGMILKKIKAQTEANFIKMNEALKERAEKTSELVSES